MTIICVIFIGLHSESRQYKIMYRSLPESFSLAGGMQSDKNERLRKTCGMGSPLRLLGIKTGPAESIGKISGELVGGQKADISKGLQKLLVNIIFY